MDDSSCYSVCFKSNSLIPIHEVGWLFADFIYTFSEFFNRWDRGDYSNKTNRDEGFVSFTHGMYDEHVKWFNEKVAKAGDALRTAFTKVCNDYRNT